MNRLQDILTDLADVDAVSAELRSIAAANPRDQIVAVNLDAVAKRRRDLERELDAQLKARQLDLVDCRIEQFGGGIPPATAVANAILHFQSLVTVIFDAIRTAPKRRYQPSNESVRLSGMTFAAVPAGSVVVSLSIENDRLMLLESDFDRSFEILFSLLMARSKSLFRHHAEQAGVAAVTAAHAWAENSVQYGLNTTITWRKSSEERRSIVLSQSDALLLKTAIEAIGDERVEEVERDCELLGIDEGTATFRVRGADGEEVAGDLGGSFPRGRNWMGRRWYTGLFVRAERVRYATGEATVRWTLRGLTPQD